MYTSISDGVRAQPGELQGGEAATCRASSTSSPMGHHRASASLQAQRPACGITTRGRLDSWGTGGGHPGSAYMDNPMNPSWHLLPGCGRRGLDDTKSGTVELSAATSPTVRWGAATADGPTALLNESLRHEPFHGRYAAVATDSAIRTTVRGLGVRHSGAPTPTA